MNGALNERRMRRRRGRRGLKRERGLATPLPIHWPIILTNGLCSHRALCFHSLPRWAKIELRPKLLSSVVSRRDPSFSRYFFGGQRRNRFWFVILSNESVERICRIWGKESRLLRRVCRLCIEEREREKSKDSFFGHFPACRTESIEYRSKKDRISRRGGRCVAVKYHWKIDPGSYRNSFFFKKRMLWSSRK